MTEWNVDTMKTLNLAIPVLWEGLGRRVNNTDQKIRAVVFFNANKEPINLTFDGANISKINIIATGSKPLKHSQRLKLCKEIFSISKKLHKYKPVLLGVALSSTLERISDEELNDYAHIIPEQDDRKCQLLLNYDRIHKILEDKIEAYNLPKPELFKLNYIDRNSLTFYYGTEEVRSS